jgi:hypothetical protein
MLLPVFVLSGQVPYRVSVEALPASLSSACDLGSSPRFAKAPDQAKFSDRFGGRRNGVDDPRMDRQRPVDSELDADLAGMVHGRNRTEIGQGGWTTVKWEMEELQSTAR